MNGFNPFKWMAALAVSGLTIHATAQSSFGADCGCPPLASRTTVNVSTLADGNGELTTQTWTCNNIYILGDGTGPSPDRYYVGNNVDLTIEPGTVIKAPVSSGADAATLIVSRGGQIWANGLASCPIIFTSVEDPLDGTYSINNRGRWGSLIILGRATNNLILANNGNPPASDGLCVADGVGRIEGLVPNEPRNWCGGTDDNDNSGILRYVSLRHGGANIGANNEINGLTLGSVGRGTTIEYVEVVSNEDDAFEMFGGTVDLKWCSAYFCNDDYFDWDWGWRGRGQYWYGVQLPINAGGGIAAAQGDEGFESDNDDQNTNFAPFADPTIYNVTCIGRGANSGMEFKEGSRGYVANSIFVNTQRGVTLISNSGDTGYPVNQNSFHQWQSGALEINNCAFDGLTGGILFENGALAGAGSLAAFAADGNALSAGIIDFSLLIANNNAVSNGIDPVPSAAAASTPERAPLDGFFDPVKFKGAFQPGATPWTSGWSISETVDFDNSVTTCNEDVDKDGDVDVDDFLQLIGVFNTTCGN